MKKNVKKMSSYKSYNYWASDILKSNPKQAANFLKTSLKNFEKDGDTPSLLLALRQIAQAQGGMTKLSDKTKLTRESLYKILSKDGNPTITTLNSILDALGYALTLRFVKTS